MSIVKTYDGPEPIRVNKFMAQSGLSSRREADALIAQGCVKVDGTVITDAGHKIGQGQTLSVETGAATDKLTILYHKPIGIVSGQPEVGEIPAIRMIKPQNFLGDDAPVLPPDLAPAGRLDKDSRGLLILTSDGVVAKALIGPESVIDKEYIVKVRGEVFEAKLKWLRHGLSLDGRKLKPAKVDVIAPQTLSFILKEGRNRQIRRMCDMCELRVIDLFRVRSGPVKIDDLPEGKWRALNATERDALVSYRP